MSSQNENFHDNDFVPVCSGVITERMKEKARLELNETEENVKEGLAKLREMIQEEELGCSEDDDYLLRFLRARKFDFKRSCEILKRHLKIPEYLSNQSEPYDEKAIKYAVEKNFLGLLPYRDAKGRAIVVIRLHDEWSHDDCSYTQITNAFLTMLMVLFEDPATQIDGYSIFMDCRFFYTQYIPTFIRNVAHYFSMQGALPARVGRIDIINDNVLVKLLYSSVRPFMSRKIKDRIFLHSDVDRLLEEYGPSILPEEFGGELGPMKSDHIIDKIEKMAKKVKEEIVAYTSQF